MKNLFTKSRLVIITLFAIIAPILVSFVAAWSYYKGDVLQCGMIIVFANGLVSYLAAMRFWNAKHENASIAIFLFSLLFIALAWVPLSPYLHVQFGKSVIIDNPSEIDLVEIRKSSFVELKTNFQIDDSKTLYANRITVNETRGQNTKTLEHYFVSLFAFDVFLKEKNTVNLWLRKSYVGDAVQPPTSDKRRFIEDYANFVDEASKSQIFAIEKSMGFHGFYTSYKGIDFTLESNNILIYPIKSKSHEGAKHLNRYFWAVGAYAILVFISVMMSVFIKPNDESEDEEK
ncbi:hypothetical protein [Candidatus Venteria ishoeyi]|uniref:ResB-like domain-containing protein n=1 Tax=Candidatus Venteria ishoeyi TaxID=1899563 RepID=A0A1H6F7K3_9GAMM|nr:hypothetical protein [Candidatus Venteria ishoeyi]SEH05299.1 Uncharacterised protein [Candidatus Venteria ishoeyi]